ncbi:hypothetical protein PUR71_24905 [Streptomyces sp. SP17BM10]|nr:hypothetical protein [Streptomyces sp. SP17BM10]MEE1786113.1 hypothetical protein [Streptomyces sp. SP17BM10]
MTHPHLPTTRSAVLPIEAVAGRPDRTARARHDLGRDQTIAGPIR